VARIYIERQDLPEDVRRLFDEILDGSALVGSPAGAECSPPVDVVETNDSVEVVMDLPGIPPSAVQVIFARNILLIAGHKAATACDHRHQDQAAFLLAERAFGRFARAVRLDGAFEGGRAAATLTAGELRVAIPRIEERRGREIRIPVRA
jgi:HSP20 family protein